ncbi:NAD(P)/FAD-dependent oxidoreductase [Dactylosporangium sp. CS-033363]|uniref:NAD(P)/FAD-dependent oxidoreductase n=1 Tax=Dactylosporangium sp. CS-033363 TaxID=3239935 RepID=UPI003D946154
MRRIAVVGASLAGLEAAKELRRAGFTGELVVFGAEERPPYDRPPLSKELLTGDWAAPRATLPLDTAADADWRLGMPVTRLQAGPRTVEAGGATEDFDGIVVATGAEPVRPALRGADGLLGVHLLRDLDQSLALAAELASGPGRVCIVGGGFIGAEVASAARARGLAVTVVEGLAAPMERALGPEVGGRLAAVQRDHGVDLRLGTTVTGVEGGRRVERARLSDGTTVAADVLVLAVGARPVTGWLAGSGLTVEDGVVCDETCLAAPGIVAAGDVAVWPNRRFGELRRVEHWDNAIRQGRHAARRLLAGDDPAGRVPYTPVPWVWSDQFGRKLQIVGSTAAYDEVRTVPGQAGDGRFTALYRRGERLVAVAALDSPRSIVKARGLLQAETPWRAAAPQFD